MTRRPISWLEGMQMPPPYGGFDADSAPESIPTIKGPLVENFLVDRDGQLPIRGPINDYTSFITAQTGTKPIAPWTFNNSVLVGLKAVSGSAVRVPWVAPYRRTSDANALAQASTTAWHIDLETGTPTAVTVSAATAPGHRHTRLGAYVYGLGYDSATVDSVNGGQQRRRALLRWDGTATAPTAYANGPLMSQDIKAHNQRIFVLGGMEPGTTTYRPNALYFSDLDGPTSDTLAMWQDDVSGLTNKIIVDSDNADDFGVALAKVGTNLAIFKRRSIHVLAGYSSSTYVIRTFTNGVGCVDPRSVIEYEDGCFFMSDQGYMYFDGAQLVNVSRDAAINSDLLVNAIAAVGDAGIDGGRVTCGRLPNNYIGVSIGTSDSSSSDSTTSFCAMYHVPTRRWVKLSSNIFVGGKPTHFGRGLSKTFLMDDIKVVQANKIVQPELEVAASRGFDAAAPLFTFDAAGTGPIFNGTGDTLKNQITGLEAWTSANVQYPINAKFYTKLQQLAEPFHNVQLHRLMLDYSFAVNGGADDQYSGWYVSLVNGAGKTLVPEYQLPSQGDPTSTYAYRRENTKDVFAETADAQLRVEWRGTTALALTRAAIFNAALAFQTTQQRRST